MNDLQDKTVLVTGAAGRLGKAFSRSIVTAGGKVLLNDTHPAVEALADELGRDNARSVQADVTSAEGVEKTIGLCVENFGKMDAAVHAAYPRSAGWGTSFEALKPEHLYEDLNRQLGGAILLSQKAMRQFLEQGFGNLVHLASIQGIAAPKFEHYEGTAMTSPVEYTAMKHGILGLVKWLAKYHRQKNVRINCISLGGILDNQPAAFLKKYRDSCNSKGMLEPEDVCGTLLFLLSENSRFITGQNIVVDDGWSL